MIDKIISTLTSTTSVTDFVPADNIYPLFRLQGGELPAVVVQLVGTTPVDTHDHKPDVDEHSVEITVFHVEPRSAWRVSVAIRQALERENSISGIDQVRFETQATDVFEVQDAFSVTQRYGMFENR